MELQTPSFSDSNGLDDTLLVFPLYLLDSIKKGTIFNPETCDPQDFSNWVSHFHFLAIQKIPFSSETKRVRIQEIWNERSLGKQKMEDIKKDIKSIDLSNEKSIYSLLEEVKRNAKEEIEGLKLFFKDDQFPSYLWMELDRFSKIQEEMVSYFGDILLKIPRFAPKKSQYTHEKNKQVQAVSRVYFDLIEQYFQVILNYLSFFTFMEVGSCKKEEELFTAKCIWSFEKIDKKAFNFIFADFHVSLNQLKQTFFKFNPEQAHIEISKPTDWAFKQLIVMT